MPTDTQRKLMVDRAQFLVNKQPQVHYAATRPMRNFVPRKNHWPAMQYRLNHGGSMTADCSESCTMLCYWAGLKDPNGFGYNGWGNSHTMWQHLGRYSNPTQAHPGALGVFGFQGDEHVIMVMERGHDPIVFSHGFEGGPLKLRLSEEKRYHRGQNFTFLDISKL